MTWMQFTQLLSRFHLSLEYIGLTLVEPLLNWTPSSTYLDCQASSSESLDRWFVICSVSQSHASSRSTDRESIGTMKTSLWIWGCQPRMVGAALDIWQSWSMVCTVHPSSLWWLHTSPTKGGPCNDWNDCEVSRWLWGAPQSWQRQIQWGTGSEETTEVHNADGHTKTNKHGNRSREAFGNTKSTWKMNRGLCLHMFATHVLRLNLMHTDGYRCILKFAAARFALDEVAVSNRVQVSTPLGVNSADEFAVSLSTRYWAAGQVFEGIHMASQEKLCHQAETSVPQYTLKTWRAWNSSKAVPSPCEQFEPVSFLCSAMENHSSWCAMMCVYREKERERGERQIYGTTTKILNMFCCYDYDHSKWDSK